MNIYWFSIIFIIWYTLSLIISERYGKRYRIGVEWSFFLSMVLTPVVGLLVLFFSGKKEQG